MSQVPFGLTNSKPPQESELLEGGATIDYKYELIRKTIHLCSLSIPIIYFFISKQQGLMLLVPVAAAFFVVDLARYYHPPTRAWFYRWFGWLLRKHESDHTKKRFTGATNILLSAILCVFIFPKIITINAFAILIISDTTSALIGRRFGRKKFFSKSREGSLAFFLSAIAVVLVAPKIEGLPLEYIIGIIGGVVGTIVESLSVKIDDNISIPLSIGVAMWGLYALLLPSVNVFALQ